MIGAGKCWNLLGVNNYFKREIIAIWLNIMLLVGCWNWVECVYVYFCRNDHIEEGKSVVLNIDALFRIGVTVSEYCRPAFAPCPYR